jgi:hypothetical protein
VTVHFYYLIGAVMLLVLFFLLMRASQRHQQNKESNEVDRQDFNCDSLAAELSTRIFSREDSDFVSSETPVHVAHAFQRERRTLALAWLRGVRAEVSCLFRSHLKAARRNQDLRPAAELRLAVHFLAFQLTTGLLYTLIRTRGPRPAARLVLLSLDLSDKLLGMAKDILPNSGAVVSVELLELDPHVNNPGPAR